MSQPLEQPTPNPYLALELARIAIDGAFAEAACVMRENDLTEDGITHEFMAHGVDRLLGGTDDLDTLRGKAHALVSDIVDGVSDAMETTAAPPPSGEPAHAPPGITVAEDEARFVTRLTIDMCLAQLRANNGMGRPNVPGVVTQVIGTLQEARRQLAQLRSGETAIVETPAQHEVA